LQIADNFDHKKENTNTLAGLGEPSKMLQGMGSKQNSK